MRKTALFLLPLIFLHLFSGGILGSGSEGAEQTSDSTAIGIGGEGKMALSEEALAAIEASAAAYEETQKTNAVSQAASFAPGWPAENSYYINGLDYYPTSGNQHSPIYAVDIGPVVGQSSCNILAAATGTVIYVNDNDSVLSYGNYLMIDHGNGYFTVYAHLAPDSIQVAVGDTVSQGQRIAVMGQTGNATGVHLHYEIRPYSSSTNMYTLDYYIDDPLIAPKFCFYKGLETKSVRYGTWIAANYTKSSGCYYLYTGSIFPAITLTPSSQTDGIIQYQVNDDTIKKIIAAQTTANTEPLQLTVAPVANANRYEITLSTATVDRLIAAESVLPGLKFITDFSTLTLDAAYLSGLKTAAAGNSITFYFRNAGIYYIYGMKTGTKEINAYGKGKATATISYTLPVGNDGNATYVRGINSDSTSFIVSDSICDANSGAVRFNLKNVVKYFVGYQPVAYSDTASSWGACYISFLSARGIMEGMGAESFSPDGKLTRAQMVTLLARVAGADVSASDVNPFADVAENAWYASYVKWAYDTGISTGRTETLFDPGAFVTRQEMAVMMQRLAKAIGYTLPQTAAALAFSDAAKISAYAKEAVAAMQRAGIISGRTGNVFDPKGSATRCEAAKMIAIFIQGMI